MLDSFAESLAGVVKTNIWLAPLVALVGVMLRVACSVGHRRLVLVGGTLIGPVQKLADSKGWTHGTDVLRPITGVACICFSLSSGFAHNLTHWRVGPTLRLLAK